MSKRVLIGLLAVSILAMWGGAANATNRINGMIVTTGSGYEYEYEVEVITSIYADVTLCGNPLQDTTKLTLEDFTVKVKVGDAYYSQFFVCNASRTVFRADFTGDPQDAPNPLACENNATAKIRFVFNLLSSGNCEEDLSYSGENSEEIVINSVNTTARWECTGIGPQCQAPTTLIEEVTIACDGTQCNTPEDVTSGLVPPPVPVSKEQCKKGGWMHLFDSQGNSFKNQGDCVSFVATGGRNLGAIKP